MFTGEIRRRVRVTQGFKRKLPMWKNTSIFSSGNGVDPVGYFCKNPAELTEEAITELLSNEKFVELSETILKRLAQLNWECCKLIAKYRHKAVQPENQDIFPRQDLWLDTSLFMGSLKEAVTLHQKLNTMAARKKYYK